MYRQHQRTNGFLLDEPRSADFALGQDGAITEDRASLSIGENGLWLREWSATMGAFYLTPAKGWCIRGPGEEGRAVFGPFPAMRPSGAPLSFSACWLAPMTLMTPLDQYKIREISKSAYDP